MATAPAEAAAAVAATGGHEERNQDQHQAKMAEAHRGGSSTPWECTATARPYTPVLGEAQRPHRTSSRSWRETRSAQAGGAARRGHPVKRRGSAPVTLCTKYAPSGPPGNHRQGRYPKNSTPRASKSARDGGKAEWLECARPQVFAGCRDDKGRTARREGPVRTCGSSRGVPKPIRRRAGLQGTTRPGSFTAHTEDRGPPRGPEAGGPVQLPPRAAAPAPQGANSCRAGPHRMRSCGSRRSSLPPPRPQPG
jgi:hypothetical protein